MATTDASTPAKRITKPLALDDAAFRNFDSLPDSAYVRAPTVGALYSCAQATLWRRIKEGRIPQPVKLSPRHTAWRVGDLRAHMRAMNGAA